MGDKHISAPQSRPATHHRGRSIVERSLMETTRAKLVRVAYVSGLSVKKFSLKAAEEIGANPALIQKVCGGRDYCMHDQPELDRVIGVYSKEPANAR